MRVYNISGQLVKILAASCQPAGKHSVEWDARDDFGRAVANGKMDLLQAEASKDS